MSVLNRTTKLFLATTAIAAAIPLAASLGQPAAPAPQVIKTPSAPLPPPPDMPPLSPAEISARQARGNDRAQAAPDWTTSRRSDFDKALPNPYAINQTWYTMPKGRFLGGISGIMVDNDGKSIWIAERCGGRNNCIGSHVDPVMKFSADGKVLIAFGKDMINYPHGLWIDHDNNVWVTDLQSNMPQPGGRGGRGGAAAAPQPVPAKPLGATVMKFTPKGKLLMTLGTPSVYGNDETHFSQPSDVVTDKDGNIYVADGHDSLPANNRIVKFDKTGKFIMAWPTCHPSYARQIDCSHSIEIDSQGRIFVAIRGNNVIDIYEQQGKRLAVWPHFGKPTGLYIDRNDILYVSDSQTGIGNGNSFMKGTHIGSARTGEVTAFLPDPLGNPAPWSFGGGLTPEGVTADRAGRVYTASVTPPGMARWTLQYNTKVTAPGGRGGE